MNKNEALSRLKVLAVEDDQVMRRLIRVNLEVDGLHVCEARTHDECLSVAKENSCHLLLLSQEVPNEDAVQVVVQVREEWGWAMPVLLVTSDVPPKSLLNALEPAAYIRKPFDAGELTRCVHRLLGGMEAGASPLAGKSAIC